MNKYTLIILLSILMACKQETNQPSSTNTSNLVASIQGQQLTGVTIHKGKIYVNFPRWRKNIKHSVATFKENGTFKAYPNKTWNNWKIGQEVSDSVFVAVQSVVASNNKLYVVDTRNPGFEGVIGQPIIFVFNLDTDQLIRTYQLSPNSFHSDSYINDVRIDEKRQYAYFTDSGHAGLVLLNLKTGESKRVLNNHFSTLSEVDHLTIDNKQWKNTVHSDGIAFDKSNGILYYHALTGYNLYAVSVDSLIHNDSKSIESSVKKIAKTAAPDGMIIHKGFLYYADLEHHKIEKLNLKTKKITTVLEGDKVKWADTFTIENGTLYYTNSRIHQTSGNISELEFTIYKTNL